jgi:hypothetical protein
MIDDEIAILTARLTILSQIHQYMAGRIKILKDGIPVNAENVPELGYEYETPSDYDAECGTYGLNEFQVRANNF